VETPPVVVVAYKAHRGSSTAIVPTLTSASGLPSVLIEGEGHEGEVAVLWSVPQAEGGTWVLP